MDRKAGSGRQRTITTEENKKLIANLICSQEVNPGSQISPREVKKNTSLSCTSRKANDKERRIKAVQTFEENHDEFRYARKTNKNIDR